MDYRDGVQRDTTDAEDRPERGRASRLSDFHRVAKPLAGVRCLVIEDHNQPANMGERSLEHAGAELRTVGTLIEAIRALSANACDLVVVDFIVQKGSGEATAEKDPRRPRWPGILVLSNRRESGNVLELHPLGTVPVRKNEFEDRLVALASQALTRAPRDARHERSSGNVPKSVDLVARTAVEFKLTSREREVFALLMAGVAPKEIGSRLGIQEVTVRRHTQETCRKCGQRCLRELLAWFARMAIERSNDAGR